MPYHHNFDQNSLEKRAALATGLKMKIACRPDWLIEAIAVHSALTREEKNIDKVRHLELAQDDRASILEWESFQRKRAKGSVAEAALLAAEWGVIELRVQPPRGKGDGSCEDPVLLVRPQAIADEPLLLQDLIYLKEYWAIDLRLTSWLRWYLDQRYSGPGELNVDEGDSFLEAATITIIGLSDALAWQVAGEALGAIFNDRFDADVAALIKKVRRVHRSAHR